MSQSGSTEAAVHLATTNLRGDLGFFGTSLGMRLDQIYPADDPRVAIMSGHGLRICLEQNDGPSGHITLRTDDTSFADGVSQMTAPGGTLVTIAPLNPVLEMPETVHSFVVRRLADQAPWVIGRAGMQYRDLIPNRLGGSIIASHIRIPDGGPVPDMVHFHKVGFQLIFCYKGWVDVVYEDQGGPIRLHAGDCFIQPPEIRHRVLEASDG
ncbi:MAG: cupin, partial [Pseudomonadota bacterium]